MKHSHYDVVVVGGGHAGTEAAHASARMGVRTALVTLRRDGIGVMSCNPAIGGLGKGHLVREIDAMDGVMGRVADLAGIQFRLLNRRKGPAVQGPRAQADRSIYRTEVLKATETQPNLDIIEGEVIDFLMEDENAVRGVRLADESEISASAVVLTSGTFLNGVIHIGNQSKSGGRMDICRAPAGALQISLVGSRIRMSKLMRLSAIISNFQLCMEVISKVSGHDIVPRLKTRLFVSRIRARTRFSSSRRAFRIIRFTRMEYRRAYLKKYRQLMFNPFMAWNGRSYFNRDTQSNTTMWIREP